MKFEDSRYPASSYWKFQENFKDYGNIALKTKKSKSLSSLSNYSESLSNLQKSLEENSTILEENFTTASTATTANHPATTLFPTMKLQLGIGMNLALHGFGSKISLIDSFISSFGGAAGAGGDTEYIKFYRIRAYQQFHSLQEDLSRIFGATSSSSDFPRKLPDMISFISENFLVTKGMLYIFIIEGIDSSSFRGTKLHLLNILNKNPLVRLVLTMSHANSPSLLQHPAHELSLCWHNVSSTEGCCGWNGPDLLMTVLENNMDEQLLEGRKVEGAKWVLESLTKTGREVFSVIAEYQINLMSTDSSNGSGGFGGGGVNEYDVDGDEDEEDDTNSNKKDFTRISISVVEWYQQCQENFIVSNESSFRTQLTEFRDHELICAASNAANSNNSSSHFYIPFTRTQIISLLQSVN